MSGGVALNGAIRREMAATLGVPVLFNENAQYFGALGAALYAYRKSLE
jgi:activator of 2-hydroxyglutaryl-CoA dehydratase